MFQPPQRASGPRPGPFALSLALHATVFSLAVLTPGGGPKKKPVSLYQEIFGKNAKKLVWYRFSKKLPEVTSSEKQSGPRGAKDRNAEQTIVSRPDKAPDGKQMTWLPAPEAPRPKEIQAPNLLAFEGPKLPGPPPKLFVPPDIVRTPKPELLPDAPQAALSAELRNPQIKEPKTPPKPFEAPQAPRRSERVELEAAPQARAQADLSNPLVDLKPKVPARKFVAPQPAARARLELDAAPQVKSDLAVSANPIANPKLKVPARAFVAPAGAPRQAGAPLLASAPAPGSASAPPPALALGAPQVPGKPQPKAFVPPGRGGPASAATPVEIADAPPPGGSSVSAAVIGVNPAAALEPVLPDATQRAKLSASPQPDGKDGSGSSVETAKIFAPDLMIRSKSPPVISPPDPGAIVSPGSAPPAEAALKRELLAMSRVSPTAFASRPPVGAARVQSYPDERFEGRAVYSMAVQAANVTSHSGSWLMWFSERDAPSGGSPEIRAPVPLRKVDPTYAPSAVEQRVEGKVKLSAIIRKDGRVDMVRVLNPVDQRLDQSAIDALRKWEFEPAQRSGQPVEVDVMVEIPFRLAPLASR